MMIEWPGRCSRCQSQIATWTDAGFYNRKWIHKDCYVELRAEAEKTGRHIAELKEPTERRHQLEWPMLGFLLMFHFGLGAAAIGWIFIDQGGSTLTGSVLIAIGIIVPLIGIAGAFGLTKFLQTMLFGVSTTDPTAFVSAPLLLGVVALLACYVPARRATRVDPVRVLKQE